MVNRLTSVRQKRHTPPLKKYILLRTSNAENSDAKTREKTHDQSNPYSCLTYTKMTPPRRVPPESPDAGCLNEPGRAGQQIDPTTQWSSARHQQESSLHEVFSRSDAEQFVWKVGRDPARNINSPRTRDFWNKISLSRIISKHDKTKSTPCCKLIQKRVILSSVIGNDVTFFE